MNITLFTCNHRKSKSVTYGVAQQLIDTLLEDGTLYEFCLPQDMPHVCEACYACFTVGEETCPGRTYLEPILKAMSDSELLIFCVPVYVFHLPRTAQDLFGPSCLSMGGPPGGPGYAAKTGSDHHSRCRCGYETSGAGCSGQHELLVCGPNLGYPYCLLGT